VSPVEPTALTDEPSVGTLVQSAMADFSTLVRGEIELAKAEVGKSAKKAGIGVGAFGAAGVLLAGTRNGVTAPRNVFVSPNVIIDDAVHRFSRMVGLDESDRVTLEERLAEHTGFGVDALRLPNLVGERADHSALVIHDRDDREVDFEHGERLAELWPTARLHETTGLGHRRILRDEEVLRLATDLLREGVEPPVSDLVREVDRQLEQQA
jgi:pimeloyl-ACP methyl ester carboxylesterase